jgi:hypothetical protein
MSFSRLSFQYFRGTVAGNFSRFRPFIRHHQREKPDLGGFGMPICYDRECSIHNSYHERGTAPVTIRRLVGHTLFRTKKSG